MTVWKKEEWILEELTVLEDEIGLQGPIYETRIFFVLIHLSRLTFLAVI